jgi:hypothetical protein
MLTLIIPKLSDLYRKPFVASGFSLRLSPPYGLIKNPLKLRNLKVAATCPTYVVRADVNGNI